MLSPEFRPLQAIFGADFSLQKICKMPSDISEVGIKSALARASVSGFTPVSAPPVHTSASSNPDSPRRAARVGSYPGPAWTFTAGGVSKAVREGLSVPEWPGSRC